jgi:hypothetical protein
MNKKRTLYTTSEYIDHLELQSCENMYHSPGKDFGFFSNPGAADYDAQWLVDSYKREGVKKRKPTVYRIKFERVKLRTQKARSADE